MAIVKCPSCGNSVDTNLGNCFRCGTQVMPSGIKASKRDNSDFNMFAQFVAAIIILALLAGGYLLLFDKHQSSGVTLYLKKGELENYTSIPSNTDLYVLKKDGTYDPRANDLEEMCRDYVFYRNKILEYTHSGDYEKASGAKNTFNQINNTLTIQYYEDDIQQMFTLIK
jgi:hypothetical protein